MSIAPSATALLKPSDSAGESHTDVPTPTAGLGTDCKERSHPRDCGSDRTLLPVAESNPCASTRRSGATVQGFDSPTRRVPGALRLNSQASSILDSR